MKSKAAFFIQQPRTLAHFDRNCSRYALLTLHAPAAEKAVKRAPVNTAFVIDRSGSMRGRKLHLACKAVRRALEHLDGDDRFSVVAFGSEPKLVFPSALASPGRKEEARAHLASILAGGNTDLSGGWLTGCAQIADHLHGEEIGRSLLLTDGIANRGIVGHEELATHAAELRKRGISTSTFGLGQGFDEGLLGAMAESGGGSFYFIEDELSISASIRRELGEALEVVARDVRLYLKIPKGVEVSPIGPFATSMFGSTLVFELPDMVSAQELVIPLKVHLPQGAMGSRFELSAYIEDRSGRFRGLAAGFEWTCASSQLNREQVKDWQVLRRVGGFLASLARRMAVLLNRQGEYEEAEEYILEAAERITSLAGGDSELCGLAASLREEAEEYARRMESQDQKRIYSSSTNSLRSKLEDGSSMRIPYR
jgi:Ca-activated chloride channel homolog